MNYYEILEIAQNASQEIIKIAYKNLAKKFHPDTSSEENAAARMQEINRAYEILSDPQKRAEYDEYLASFFGSATKSTGNGTVKNINEILSKIARTYSKILDNNEMFFNDADSRDNTYLLRKCQDYLDLDANCKIYVVYSGVYSSNNSRHKMHNVMALTENGIVAYSEFFDGWAKNITWEEVKQQGVHKESDEITIGAYRFKCTSASDLYEILKEIEKMLIHGYLKQTEDQEINETIAKKAKRLFPTFVIYIGAMIFFNYKGWNSWIIKIIDGLLIGTMWVCIYEITDLYLKNNILKNVIKWLTFGIGALIWYKITR